MQMQPRERDTVSSEDAGCVIKYQWREGLLLSTALT